MNKTVYDTLIAKIATLEPWFAKALVDGAIARAGRAHYSEVTPVEMLHLLKNDIEPRLGERLSGFRSVLTAAAGLLVTDAEDHIVHVNPIMRRLLDSLFVAHGQTRPVRDSSPRYTSAEAARMLQGVGLLRPAREVVDVEVRKVRCEPLGRVINSSLAPLGGPRAGTGRTGLCCVYQDVTLSEEIELSLEDFFAELTESHALLRESETRYKNIVEHTGDVIMVTEPDGTIAYLSPSTRAVLGHDPAALIGTRTSITHADDRERIHGLLSRALHGHAGSEVEYRVVTADGQSKWITHSWTPLHRDGRVHQVVSVVRDVTARKHAERELLRGKRLAEAASEAKSQFLANMSHELRTPMNAILGLVDMLLGSDLTDEQRTHATLARSSATSLLAVLNDVLDVSRIEAGTLTLEHRAFVLRETLEPLRDLYELRAHDKGLTFHCRADPSLPRRLLGDPGRLRQILTNLLDNAVKFTDSGSISLTVSHQQPQRERVVLRFVITDTGVGIPASHLDGLFEAFTQVDASLTRRHGGAGLGLAISRQLVDQMGGRLRIDSVVGEGTTLTATLPFDRPPEREDEVGITRGGEAARAAPGPCAHAARPPAEAAPLAARVLLAEDNPVNQLVAVGMLRKLGCDVEVVTDGQQAVDRLEQEGFDLVLMDVQMPVMDGLEATRRIRALAASGEARGIPIVAMTAHAMTGDRERCLAAGMDDYLSKPVEPAALAATLARWMRR